MKDDFIVMSTEVCSKKPPDVCSILFNNDYAKSVVVPEAKQHQDGYTVYKVILQAIAVKRTIEENPLTYVAWKRFRDLYKLHRRIVIVHAQLYLKGVVPSFPKPDFFGRLEPSVVEERRQASEEFLLFVVRNSILCQCEAVLAFFSGAEYQQCLIANPITGVLDVIPAQALEPLVSESPICRPSSSQINTRSFSDSSDMSDDISLHSPPTASKAGQHNHSCGGNDFLAVFDPFPSSSESAGTSNYQILSEIMSEIQVSGSEEATRRSDLDDKQRGCVPSSDLNSDESACRDNNNIAQDTKNIASCQRMTKENTIPKWRSKIADFFPKLSPSSSKQFDDPNDITLKTNELKTVKSESHLSNNKDIDRRGFPANRAKYKRGGSLKTTQTGVSRQFSLDYVLQAAEFISSAQKAEEENAFDLAFTCYKSAVMLLLQGVQDEKDLNRRNAVRLKTAKYLRKAEKLYQNYIATDVNSSFCLDGFTSRFLSNFGIMGFQSVYSELSQYEVLRVFGRKVQLVRDTTSGEKYVIKFLYKSCYNSAYSPTKILDQCVPTRVPHMVKLVKFWDTETAIVILLEYAAGGQLWHRLRTYFERAYRMFTAYYDKKQAVDEKTIPDHRRRSGSADDATMACTKPTSVFDANRHKSGSDPGNLQSGRDFHLAVERSFDDDIDDGGLSPHLHGLDRDTSLFALYEQKSKTTRVSAEDTFSFDTLSSPAVTAAGQRRFSLLYSDDHFNREGNNLCDIVEEHLLRKWIAQLTVALGYLHGEGVLCRDLNPDNLLLDEQENILLTFFCEWNGIDRPFNVNAANMLYSAPEVNGIIGEPLTDAVDWWSLGVLLYEIVTGTPLHIQCPHHIGPNTVLPLPDYLSVELRDLINRLVRYDAEDRLGSCFGGVDEIKMHPFFIDFDWHTVEPS